MTQVLTVLGLESSCDDTSAAVLQYGASSPVLSNVVIGQSDLHAPFGGVVPEIAARAHAEKIDVAVRKALEVSKKTLHDIDLIAVTSGPGLIGGVLAGVMCAKGVSAATGLPLVGVNHLAGHALTPRMTDNVVYPYMMLLVSGGHCQFLLVESVNTFRRLGGTIDDAPGEAFDKVARLLALPQPGGPAVEKEALRGDPKAYRLPRPLLDREGCDLSFSGLKTAVLRARDKIIAEQGGLPQQARADLCASFQAAVRDVLTQKTQRALALCPQVTALCVAGGVAANAELRTGLQEICDLPFIAPPLALCTDNAAMIAWAGAEKYAALGSDPNELIARPRWPLDQTAVALLGSGKKGPKA